MLVLPLADRPIIGRCTSAPAAFQNANGRRAQRGPAMKTKMQGRALRDRDHRGSNLDSIIEIEHIFIIHADATIGRSRTDRSAHMRIRSVNGDLITSQCDRSSAHRIVR